MNRENTKYPKVMVSLFDNLKANSSNRQVELFDWFFDPQIKKQVEYTRKHTEGDKELYNNHKELLPCITPCGIFTNRKDDALEQPSGFICIDIDGKDNMHITDMHAVRNEISKIKNIAFCALSLSGNGLFCFIPILYPEKTKEHYNALIKIFEKLGINIDKKCGNLSRLRVASYDANAYINRNAIPFELYIDSKKKSCEKGTATYFHRKTSQHKRNSKTDFESVYQQIIEKGIDITDGYEAWFGIGCALANEFGEEGRQYFHELSQFNNSYNEHKTDYQYDSCLHSEKNNFTIGTFFYYAKQQE